MIPASNSDSLWPFGGSQLAKLIRNFDWSATSLGPMTDWPAYVRNCINVILASPAALITLWNDDAVMIYNDAYAVFAGKKHPSSLGSKAMEVWPEVADFNRRMLSQVLTHGGTLTFHDQELTLYRNGVAEQVWLDLYYSPIVDEENRPRGVLAVVIETTRRVLAERHRDRVEDELLQANFALQRANADLEQFAFSASHDLQEPVRMVSIYSQLLRRKLAGKLDADAERLIKNCIDGARRLEDLLKDLLEYTHIEAPGDSQPLATSFVDILEKALKNLETVIQESEATISWDEFPPLTMHGVHLYQLLQNLMSNALKYRSKLPLKIHVGVERREAGWLFFIRDNGIGIEPVYQKQIFGLFKRLHTSTEYEGTGLGLAICRKLAERYGGSIWVESSAGEGATFYFTLPVAVGEPIAHAEPK